MAVVIHLLIVMLALAAPSAAQSTRVDAIAREQAEKAKAVDREGPTGMGVGAGFLKRFANASYFTIQSGIAVNHSMLLRGASFYDFGATVTINPMRLAGVGLHQG